MNTLKSNATTNIQIQPLLEASSNLLKSILETLPDKDASLIKHRPTPGAIEALQATNSLLNELNKNQFIPKDCLKKIQKSIEISEKNCIKKPWRKGFLGALKIFGAAVLGVVGVVLVASAGIAVAIGQIPLGSGLLTLGIIAFAGARALFKNGTADCREAYRISQAATQGDTKATPITTTRLDKLKENIESMKATLNAYSKTPSEQAKEDTLSEDSPRPTPQ